MSGDNELHWCSNCLSMSTRPRITFDDDGLCNACQWTVKKKTLDWGKRMNYLNELLEGQRSKKHVFDCLVPVSGGKDGSYVAHQIKHKFGLNPLCVTILPPLSSALGLSNLHNFISSGYDHITISPSQSGMQKLNKIGFIEKGFPYYGWLIAIHTAVYRVAANYGIDLIFYGEDGEVEYGGLSKTEDAPIFNIEYQKAIYLENGHDFILDKAELSDNERFFFTYPDTKLNIRMTHWSYYENWNPYRNYLVAKEYCGLEEAENTNSGTFTNFAQNDQDLYALHSYLMYLKFGFGRANQDACIEIRRGAMSREQGRNLVTLYDGTYPKEYVQTYLDYYGMTETEFDEVLDRWANIDILEKIDGRWKPRFTII